jgi:hypothetical protein
MTRSPYHQVAPWCWRSLSQPQRGPCAVEQQQLPSFPRAPQQTGKSAPVKCPPLKPWRPLHGTQSATVATHMSIVPMHPWKKSPGDVGMWTSLGPSPKKALLNCKQVVVSLGLLSHTAHRFCISHIPVIVGVRHIVFGFCVVMSILIKLPCHVWIGRGRPPRVCPHKPS